jgi:hypothetical protein
VIKAFHDYKWKALIMAFVLPQKYTYLDARTYSDMDILYVLAISKKVYYDQNLDLDKSKLKLNSILMNGMMPYCLTTDYIKEVEEDLEWTLQEISFKVLQDTVTSYEKNLANALKNKKFGDDSSIKLVNNGIISSFPLYVKQARERERYEDIISKISKISDYIGELKLRTTLKVQVISKRYIKDKGFWVINALHDNKNLIVYFTNDTTGIVVGNSYKIRGTPVKHEISLFNKCKETRLSRVMVETSY